jgi:hypothetical protein
MSRRIRLTNSAVIAIVVGLNVIIIVIVTSIIITIIIVINNTVILIIATTAIRPIRGLRDALVVVVVVLVVVVAIRTRRGTVFERTHSTTNHILDDGKAERDITQMCRGEETPITYLSTLYT